MSGPIPAGSTSRLITLHEAILAALLVAVLAFAAWLEPSFIGLNTQRELSTHAIELALLSIPTCLVIVSGGIDLSVGSIMALAAVVLGMLHESGINMGVGALAAVAVGAAAGSLNGAFVAAVRVHPLIVTLATFAAFRGLAEGVSLGRPISGFPDFFLRIGSGMALGVPLSVLMVLLIAAAGLVAVRRSVAGAWVYAIGDNERAARYCGIPVDKVKIALYTLNGAAAGLAGVLYVARRNTAKADVGSGMELEVITAVVLGGTSIFGGRGTILGTLLGVALIHELRELVSWHWQHDELVRIVIGTILIASILLNNVVGWRRP